MFTVQRFVGISVFACVIWIHGVFAQCTSDPTGFTVTSAADSITITWTAATGSGPITYDFSSSIDGSVAHAALTDTSYVFTGLQGGVSYDATTRVQATCNGVQSEPYTEMIQAGTIPMTPELTVNSDDDTDINLVFIHEGEADSYVIMNDFFSGGQVTTSNSFYFVSGLSPGKTYEFRGYSSLNGVPSETVSYTHKVESDAVMGMPPMAFAAFWIIFIILVIVIIIVVVVVVIYCYRKKKSRRGGVSRESTRELDRDHEDDNNSVDEKNQWNRRDPYEYADYRLTEAQRKRAFAIAAQKAAMAS